MHTESVPSPTSPCDSQKQLSQAFASFSQVAGSLERSYGRLQLEVLGLRHELEETNRDLARSLEENQRMRAYLDRILEGLPCGVVVLDGASRVRLANSETHRLLSLAPGTICPSQRLPASVERALSICTLAHEEREWKSENQKNGERWVAMRRTPLGDGSQQHTIYILRDVSEQKRMERERERIRRQEALAEMSAVLAHEIRNPLGSLELFAGLLADADREQGGEHEQWIVQLQAGLRSLSATVNNVLQFRTLPPPALVPCDLGEVLDGAFDFLSPLGKQSGMVMEICNALHGVVRPGDRNRLQQVLLNLALNAFRFTPSGGRLRFEGKLEQRPSSMMAQIQIRDTGCGIRPEHLGKIFDAGFTTRAGSPGLGLTVCKQVVEQHGGEIRVTSAPGQGTTFTLVFPLS